EKVIPALEQAKIVICDRYIDSSLANQGNATGLGMDDVFAINQFAIRDYMPNLTVFFDIETKKGLERIKVNKYRERNRLDLEELHFHELVYEAYQILAEKYPHRIQTIDANQSIEMVETDAMDRIISHLQGK